MIVLHKQQAQELVDLLRGHQTGISVETFNELNRQVEQDRSPQDVLESVAHLLGEFREGVLSPANTLDEIIRHVMNDPAGAQMMREELARNPLKCISCHRFIQVSNDFTLIGLLRAPRPPYFAAYCLECLHSNQVTPGQRHSRCGTWAAFPKFQHMLASWFTKEKGCARCKTAATGPADPQAITAEEAASANNSLRSFLRASTGPPSSWRIRSATAPPTTTISYYSIDNEDPSNG